MVCHSPLAPPSFPRLIGGDSDHGWMRANRRLRTRRVNVAVPSSVLRGGGDGWTRHAVFPCDSPCVSGWLPTQGKCCGDPCLLVPLRRDTAFWAEKESEIPKKNRLSMGLGWSSSSRSHPSPIRREPPRPARTRESSCCNCLPSDSMGNLLSRRRRAPGSGPQQQTVVTKMDVIHGHQAAAAPNFSQRFQEVEYIPLGYVHTAPTPEPAPAPVSTDSLSRQSSVS